MAAAFAVLLLALVLGGLGFASVFAVALLVGGIYLIATGHPTGGYALAGASVLAGVAVLTLVLVAVLKVKAEGAGVSHPPGEGKR